MARVGDADPFMGQNFSCIQSSDTTNMPPAEVFFHLGLVSCVYGHWLAYQPPRSCCTILQGHSVDLL